MPCLISPLTFLLQGIFESVGKTAWQLPWEVLKGGVSATENQERGRSEGEGREVGAGHARTATTATTATTFVSFAALHIFLEMKRRKGVSVRGIFHVPVQQRRLGQAKA